MACARLEPEGRYVERQHRPSPSTCRPPTGGPTVCPPIARHRLHHPRGPDDRRCSKRFGGTVVTPGTPPRTRLEERTMTTSTTIQLDVPATEATPATAELAATDATDATDSKRTAFN